MFNTLSDFYRSKEWTEFRATIISERANKEDGFVYDEITGKPIVMANDIIAHHVIPLTLDNVNDYTISMNPDNIQLVSHKTHNQLHDRYGVYTRHIYLVYGCPLAGKTSFVRERASLHDLIIDIDRIYECISNNPLYVKSGRLTDNAFGVRDALLSMVKMRKGKWVNAYIIGGYPYKGERERLCVEYGAEGIHIPCTKEEAYGRLQVDESKKDKAEYRKYIDRWFDRYSE